MSRLDHIAHLERIFHSLTKYLELLQGGKYGKPDMGMLEMAGTMHSLLPDLNGTIARLEECAD